LLVLYLINQHAKLLIKGKFIAAGDFLHGNLFWSFSLISLSS